jgi:hypothetical protein
MSDPSNALRLEVVGVLRNGWRRYDPASKQRLVRSPFGYNAPMAATQSSGPAPREQTSDLSIPQGCNGRKAATGVAAGETAY